MKGFPAWIMTGLLAAAAAGAEEPAAALARGKLESDLGHHAVAAEAFASVADAPQATAPQRWEALVRLGVARRDAGDARGSADAFEEAWRTYGKDPEAVRFLLQGVGSALPGRERWEEVWRQVTLDVDRRVREQPIVRVTWPGAPFGLCPCSGQPVDLDFKDGDLQDIFRLFADISGLNVVVQPGTRGLVTYRASQEPWDEVLERLLAPNGLVARLEGNVLWIGTAGEAGEKRSYTGAPIDFEFEGKDLILALREIAAHGGARVEVPEGVGGKVTFKLVKVPWDQAFDLLTRVNGLTWTREAVVAAPPARGGPPRPLRKGDVLHVDPPRRAPSR
jgi:hypothetical protein